MSNIFVISDHHLGHANLLNFRTKEGKPLREFKDVDHMNESLIELHNSVVRHQDKCYFLGDIAISDKSLSLVKRMNGKLRLILGNHDKGNPRMYMPYFEAIYASRNLDRMLFTHFPIHPESIGKAKANIHGHQHLHEQGLNGPRYYNVTVEALGGVPVSLEELKSRVQKQLGETW